MKHLKKYEGFNLSNFFRSKEKEIKSDEVQNSSEILIDSIPYDVSQFGQNKYGVYIIDGDKSYYLGDIREFTKAKGPSPYMSYLNLSNIVEKHSTTPLVKPNQEQMNIINGELNKSYLSNNLMDDSITFRKKIGKDLGIFINENVTSNLKDPDLGYKFDEKFSSYVYELFGQDYDLNQSSALIKFINSDDETKDIHFSFSEEVKDGRSSRFDRTKPLRLKHKTFKYSDITIKIDNITFDSRSGGDESYDGHRYYRYIYAVKLSKI